MKKLLPAILAAFAVLPAAQALAAPHVVVWSGALAPGHQALGVELRPDGSGRVYLSDGKGGIHARGSLAAHGRLLSQIRAAADHALASAPTITHAPIVDGGYVTVVIQDGNRKRVIVDTGRTSRPVATLLQRMDAALRTGRGARAAAVSEPTSVVLRDPTPPSAAACPSGQQPTEAVKDLSLDQALQDGVITSMLPKSGVIGGDAVAVSAEFQPVSAPTRVTLHLEVAGPAGTDWGPLVKSELTAAYAGAHDQNGQPVTFDFDVVSRAPGAAPRPCYHEASLVAESAGFSSYVSGVGPSQQTGEWDAGVPGDWVLGAGNMMGLENHFQDYFHVDATGEEIPVPTGTASADSLQGIVGPGVNPLTGGDVHRVPDRGFEHSLTGGDARFARPQPFDIAGIAAAATVRITAEPGELLMNKDTGQQNEVVGSQFTLDVPYGGSAHVDGMVAYCIDQHADVPTGQHGFDAAGLAGNVGTPAMTALQRVAELVAQREPAPLYPTPGANDAIWRVTDDQTVLPGPEHDAAASILAAAGVSADPADGQTFAAPHFSDPAASSAAPVALSAPTGAPLPATPPAPLPPALGPSKLVRMRLTAPRLRLRKGLRSVFVATNVTFTGRPDRITLTLTRKRGKHTVTVARSRPQAFDADRSLVGLLLKRPAAGTYVLTVRGAHSGQLHATLKIAKR